MFNSHNIMYYWLKNHNFRLTTDNVNTFNLMVYAAKKELLIDDNQSLEDGTLDEYFELRKSYLLFD